MVLPTELPEILMVLLGVLAPFIWQFITKLVPSGLARFLVAVALSALTGVAALAVTGNMSQISVEMLSILFAFSQLAYRLIWKPLYDKNLAKKMK